MKCFGVSFHFLLITIVFISHRAAANCDADEWSSRPILSSAVEVGVWNVLKDRAPQQAQARTYLTAKDLWLFQEIGAVGIAAARQLIAEVHRVFSFRQDSRTYGMATFSRFEPCMEKAVDIDDEPVMAKIDKAMLQQTYVFHAGGGRLGRLLVINVHLPLFVLGGGFGNGAYKKALREVESSVKAHCGPVLVAGDFNAWTTNRSDYLLPELLQKTRMSEAHFERPGDGRPQTMRLDRVFYKGLRVLSAESLAVNEDLSDHNPIHLAVQLYEDRACN